MIVRSRCGVGVLAVGLLVTGSRAAAAQSADSAAAMTIRAERATTPIRVDGRLDDAAWHLASPVSGFRQVDPAHGAPASLDTEVRILFDDRYLYVGATARDSMGRAGVRVVSLDRDFDFFSNDLFGITLDPFLDRRNAVGFQTNPHGVQRDLLAFDDNLFDRDWSASWRVRTEVSDSGWTAEFAIPWSTLRYRPQANAWGVNFVRIARRINEQSGWSPWPRAATNMRMEYAGRLEGLEPPPPSRNIRLQPYATGRYRRTQLPSGAVDATDPELGGDLKWAVTPNTVVDLTVNTDFAEADVDRQVVNLSRFSTLFPERRQFFLEGAGLFETGRESGNLRPFYSRRIGLDEAGLPIPIDGGIRLVHRSGRRGAGGLLMRQAGTDRSGPSHFALARFSQNVGSGNRVGAQIIHRHDAAVSGSPASSNTVAVVDGLWRPDPTGTVRAMVSASETSGAGGDDVAAFVHAYSDKPYGYFGWIQEYVGPEYTARTGFIGRQNYIWTSPAVTLDWRPSWRPRQVRKFNPGFTTSFYHDAEDLTFREGSIQFRVLAAQFNDGSELRFWFRPEWQRLERPFTPVPGMTLGPGRYDFGQYAVTYVPDQSRPYFAFVTVANGSFYDGRRQQLIYRASPLPGPYVRFTFDYEANRFRDVGPDRIDRTTHLVSGQLRVTPTPQLGISTYYEYSSTTKLGVWNARVSWEFRPLFYLYLVYNDRRPSSEIVPGVINPPEERQLLVKVTWMGQL